MAQGEMGIVCYKEDFGSAIAQTLSDATEYRHGDVRLAAISGNVAMDIVVDEPNGIATFSGAAGAVDGVAIYTLPFRPSTNGPIYVEAYWKPSTVTTYGFFFGFQETVSVAEPVNPFTLSGTTLTANNGGNVWGLYFDTTATTDDVRAMISLDGAATTTAVNDLTGSTFGALGVRANATPTADSWIYARVELDPNGAGRAYYGDIGNDPQNSGPKLIAAVRAGAFDQAALVHPILIMVDPSTNDPLHHVDFFHAHGGRDWAYARP